MTIDLKALADLDLERAVLGQMIRHGIAYGLYLQAGLTRQDFYRDVHSLVFDAIEAVSARGETPDELVVWQELQRRNTHESIGAVHYGRMTEGVPCPAAANAQGLTQQLQDLRKSRAVRASAEKLQRELSDNRTALADGVIADHLSTLEHALSQGPEAARHRTASGQLDALERDIMRDKQGRVWLGLPTLDEAIDGCRAGEVCGLMARPGIGKTLVLCHVARVAAESELPHVLFSLEMPDHQIAERLARPVYRLGRFELREALEHGTLDKSAYQRIFDHLVVVDAAGLSVADMASQLRIIQGGIFRDRPIRLVTIDHLGLIGGDRRMTTYDRVSTQAREIKELAKRLNASVLLAVQVNRDAGGDGSRELGLGAARDSGVVEEAMDYLIALRRLDQSTTLSQMEREKYRDVLFAKVVKNRHGSTGKEIAIRFETRTLTLTEDRFIEAETSDLARIAQGRR